MAKTTLDWEEMAIDQDLTMGHGGFPPQKIQATNSLFTIRGVPVILVGDSLVAPHCDKNSCHTSTVVEGVAGCTVLGVPVSFKGAAMSCGDTIAM